MKGDKTLLLIAFTLIVVALVLGIAGANPANPAHTTTGTAHTEAELFSTGGGFTFTGTLQYK